MTDSSLHLPAEAPVMILPQAILFPHALMPLYIFEPRYRQMLAHCLQGDRMFCVAQLRPGIDPAPGDEDFFPVAGLGMIRACVGNEDGTSHLILQGLTRVRIARMASEEPFRIAELQEMTAPKPDAIALYEITSELIRRCTATPARNEEMSNVRDRLAEVDDPEVLADVVAHTFILDALQRQRLLECAEVEDRLNLLLRILPEMPG